MSPAFLLTPQAKDDQHGAVLEIAMRFGGRGQLPEYSQASREARRAMPDLGGLMPILTSPR